jgi:hypothetical protein
MSATKAKVVEDENWLEHLSMLQFGLGITPAWATSMMRVCGAPSPLIKLRAIVSPCVIVIVGPGFVPFQPEAKLPLNVIVWDDA